MSALNKGGYYLSGQAQLKVLNKLGKELKMMSGAQIKIQFNI